MQKLREDSIHRTEAMEEVLHECILHLSEFTGKDV